MCDMIFTFNFILVTSLNITKTHYKNVAQILQLHDQYYTILVSIIVRIYKTSIAMFKIKILKWIMMKLP